MSESTPHTPLRVIVAEPTRLVALDFAEEILALAPEADITLWEGASTVTDDLRPDLLIWAAGRNTAETASAFDRLSALAARTVFVGEPGGDLPPGIWQMPTPLAAPALKPHIEAVLQGGAEEVQPCA